VLPLKDDNPTTSIAWVTIVLIALNVMVFIGPQGMADPQNTERDITLEFAAIPCEVVTGDGLTDLEISELYKRGGNDTACDLDPNGDPRFPNKPERLAMVFSMFMHGGWAHLIGNIWFLWLFGNNVEDHLGKVRYLIFYLAGGIVATIAHVAVQPDSIVPVVGASGAVAAAMGAYAVWFPNAPIRTLVFIVLWRIKAKWWLGFWLITQFFIGADSQVAWMAHVGGFVFGALVGLLVRQSPKAQQRAFTPPYAEQRPWDSTGGIGDGPYAKPQRIFGR
jgi:membrane associated rhomboid family serine protease